MTTPVRTLPDEATYLVELPPLAVLGRLRADARVAVVPALPARPPSGPRFLAVVGERRFSVVHNAGPSTIDPGAAGGRGLTLEAELEPTPQGTRVSARFRPGPATRQLFYWVVWAACFLWLAATGLTSGKIVLVVAFVVITAPVYLYERRRARGTPEDRIELLNLMEHLLGPAAIGTSAAEQTPYRDGHPAPASDDDDDDDDD